MLLRPLSSYIMLSSWLVLSACGHDHKAKPSKTSIYSKSPATTNLSDLGPVSSVVAVLKNRGANCSGVALSRGYVLTAAHCVSFCGTSGSYDCRINGRSEDYLVKDRLDNEYEVDAIYLPNKVTMINNIIVEGADLALLRLKWAYKLKTAPLVTKGRAEPILRDNEDRLESPSNTLITAGYGVFEDTNKPNWIDGRLRAAFVPFRYYAGILGNDEILAGSTKVHAANGDSGGPLLVDDGSGTLRVAGITSRKITVDGMNTFDTDGIYYANVTHEGNRNWILTKMLDGGGDLDPNTSSDEGNGGNSSQGQEIAQFNSLMPSDTRQFQVPKAKEGWVNILVKGRAIDLRIMDPNGHEITNVRVTEGSTVRVDLTFATAGLHRLTFGCSNCDNTRIENLTIFTK